MIRTWDWTIWHRQVTTISRMAGRLLWFIMYSKGLRKSWNTTIWKMKRWTGFERILISHVVKRRGWERPRWMYMNAYLLKVKMSQFTTLEELDRQLPKRINGKHSDVQIRVDAHLVKMFTQHTPNTRPFDTDTVHVVVWYLYDLLQTVHARRSGAVPRQLFQRDNAKPFHKLQNRVFCNRRTNENNDMLIVPPTILILYKEKTYIVDN